jgi:hypothetical protein
MHKAADAGMDPVWTEMEDVAEDIDQYSYYMDTLKERFLNLIELVSSLLPELEDESLHLCRSSTLRTLTNLTTHASCPSSRPYTSRSRILP